MSYHPDKWFGKRLYKCLGSTDKLLTAQKWAINAESRGNFVRTIKKKTKKNGTEYLVYYSRKTKLTDFKRSEKAGYKW